MAQSLDCINAYDIADADDGSGLWGQYFCDDSVFYKLKIVKKQDILGIQWNVVIQKSLLVSWNTFLKDKVVKANQHNISVSAVNQALRGQIGAMKIIDDNGVKFVIQFGKQLERLDILVLQLSEQILLYFLIYDIRAENKAWYRKK